MVGHSGTRHSGIPCFDAVGALMRSTAAWARRRASAVRERRRLAHELAGLGDDQLDRVLCEVGVSRADLKTFLARAPQSRDLLGRMLVRLGLGVEDLRGGDSSTRRIERECTMCSAQARCHRWLDEARDASGYRAFCPNAPAFDRLLGAKAAAVGQGV